MNTEAKAYKAAAAVFCSLVSAFLFAGCRTIRPRAHHLPEDMTAAEVTDRMYAGSPSFSTLTDSAISMRFIYEDERGVERSPSVRGGLAFDRNIPGIWIYGERFGRSIFTLRSHRHDFWLELPEEQEVITGSRKAYAALPYIISPDEVLTWFAPPDWLGLTWESTIMHTTPEKYIFEVAADGFPVRSVHVDRYNFNTRAIMTYDILGRIDSAVYMDGYRNINGSAFPSRIVFSRLREKIEVHLQLGRPEFNRRIPQQAFLPRDIPSGWRHTDLDAYIQ